MLILNTVSNDKVWGTKRLYEYSGNENIETIGSVYSVSGIKEISCEIIAGDDNKDLYTAVKNNPEKFGLPKGVDYPVIISFTGADQDLSIQVHPTDPYAKEYEDKIIGKSESWYFIEEPKERFIYGESLLEDKNLIREKILDGKYEEVVDKINIEQGDLAYIQSGSLHALTKGALVYEIQQSTDITYRFYDYDRKDRYGNKRELHLDHAINSLDTSNKIQIEKFIENTKIESEPYSLVRTKLSGRYINEEDIAQAITVTKGDLEVNGHTLKQGMSCLVLPGEEITIDKAAEEVVIATPKLYFV